MLDNCFIFICQFIVHTYTYIHIYERRSKHLKLYFDFRFVVHLSLFLYGQRN